MLYASVLLLDRFSVGEVLCFYIKPNHIPHEFSIVERLSRIILQSNFRK